MDLKALIEMTNEGENAIAELRLNDAIALTKSILQDIHHAQLIDRLYVIGQDYEALLRYFLDGKVADDDSRQDVLNNLYQQLIETLHTANALWRTQKGQTFYGRIARQCTSFTTDDLIEQLGIIRTSQEGTDPFYTALDAAFITMLTVPVAKYASEKLTQVLLQLPMFAQQVMVSGIMLSLLEVFSPVKLQLLLDISRIFHAQLDDDETTASEEMQNMQARILVALTLVYLRYKNFLRFYPHLIESLRNAFSTPSAVRVLPQLQRALVCTSETDKVNEKMDDIMPFLKQAIEEQQSSSSNADEQKEQGKTHVITIKLTAADRKWLKKLTHHAREVDALRQDGFDVNSQSFVHMKNFPFFNHPSHWFYPFSELVPAAKEMLTTRHGQRDMMTLSLMNHNRFCESDRYSYLGMQRYIRERQAQRMLDELEEQIDEIGNQIDEELTEENGKGLLELSESYRLDAFTDVLQSVARFLLVSPCKNDFPNPLHVGDDLLLTLHPLFHPHLNNQEQLSGTIEALVTIAESRRAIVLIDQCIESNGATAWLLREKGHALMQMQQWKHALPVFQQAQLIDEDDSFNLLMARCHEAIGQWEEALTLLVHNEQQDPDDADLTEEVIKCLMQLHRWEEALNRLFKLEFEGKNLASTHRAIGWCCLRLGRYERAQQYLSKALEARHTAWEDYLNLGHAHWLNGDIHKAEEAYRMFIKSFNRSKKKSHYKHWTEPFDDDVRDLLSPQLSASDISLMKDALTLPPNSGSL